MSVLRMGLALSVMLGCFRSEAASQQQNISVAGTLQRMAGTGENRRAGVFNSSRR
jgi:hypothetical protein